MVSSILRFLNKEISGLHEAAYLLGFFAILSQLLALVRDRLFASYFGAGHTLDIYYASFRIPDLIFVTVASLVSMSILIPFLIERQEKGKEEVKAFLNSLFTVFFVLVVAVCAVVYVFVPRLAPLFFPDLVRGGALDEIVLLSRVLLLSPILLGISSILGSITQMTNRFFVYALSPILYNVGIIIGIVFFSHTYGARGLVFGVILGALLHVLIQVPFVAVQGLLPWITIKVRIRDVWRVMIVSIPRALSVSAPELARFALVAFAGVMAAGSISVFTFASNLQSVPLSIIGVSYSLAAFPILAKHIVQGEKGKFVEQMIAGTRHVVFLSMPIMALFIVLRAQIIRTILGSGEFTWSDTRLTAACFAIFTLSLIPQSLSLLFARAYYSKGNTTIPFVVNIISAVCTVGGGILFIHLFNTAQVFQFFMESLFKVEGLVGSVVLMLAVAYSLGSWVGFLIYWILFQKEFSVFAAPVLSTAFQSFAASVIMAFVTYKYLYVFDNVFDINTFAGIFLQGLLSGIIGIFCGVVMLRLLQNKEIVEIWGALHRKFWKAKVIGPDPEVQ